MAKTNFVVTPGAGAKDRRVSRSRLSARGIEHPGEPRRPDDRDDALFGDTVEELSGWYCFSEQYRADQETWERQARDDRVRSQRLENPFKGVGRNDPCPRGSAKKFKKCRLVKARDGSMSLDVAIPREVLACSSAYFRYAHRRDRRCCRRCPADFSFPRDQGRAAP
jgi:hypothetical protein